jgi:hypothetical protein
VCGLYLADGAATATAEWYRFLAERGLPPSRAIPHDHRIWRIELELADLSSPERLAAVGPSAPEPSRRTWQVFQDVGDALWRAGLVRVARRVRGTPRSADRLHIRPQHLAPAGCEPLRADEITDVPPLPIGMIT